MIGDSDRGGLVHVTSPLRYALAAGCMVNGWTPTLADIPTCVTFEVQAANAYGTDTAAWPVIVRSRSDFDLDADVDLEDFAVFQCCLSGSGVSPGLGCTPADLDADGDVDHVDFSSFHSCVRGASRLPGC